MGSTIPVPLADRRTGDRRSYSFCSWKGGRWLAMDIKRDDCRYLLLSSKRPRAFSRMRLPNCLTLKRSKETGRYRPRMGFFYLSQQCRGQYDQQLWFDLLMHGFSRPADRAWRPVRGHSYSSVIRVYNYVTTMSYSLCSPLCGNHRSCLALPPLYLLSFPGLSLFIQLRPTREPLHERAACTNQIRACKFNLE